MVIRQVSPWVKWAVGLGLFVPFLTFFLIKDYVPSQGFWWNLGTRVIDVPLLYSQNPLECLNYFLRLQLGDSLGMKTELNYACNFPTQVPYLNIFLLSMLSLAAGLYGFFSRQEMANLWPTEWTVHSEDSVIRKNGESKPEIHVELDRNIKGKDAGY